MLSLLQFVSLSRYPCPRNIGCRQCQPAMSIFSSTIKVMLAAPPGVWLHNQYVNNCHTTLDIITCTPVYIIMEYVVYNIYIYKHYI